MSEQIFNNVGVVILAAGKGKRMQSNQLKVMHLLNEKPLIDHVVSAVESLNLATKPTVVVCNENPAVQDYLGDRANYVVQAERLGTGHAVAQAESVLSGKVDQVVVLYGDMPFIKPESIKKLISTQLERNNIITLATVTATDFNDWRASLIDYGRIVRGGTENHIIKIVEKKDSSPEELEIKEFNTGFYCFNAEWLWKNLKNLKNNNVQSEYYLTDLVGLAVAGGNKISSVSIEPKEAVGINTKENLEVAHTI